jgi:hypothetical protein
MRSLVSGPLRPRTGDIVLARVDRLRQHKRLELPSGRKAQLNPGDEIIVAYADRYATDQFESHVPPDLGPTNLVASGGVASQMLSHSAAVSKATEITPLGLVGDEAGVPLNVDDFALPPVVPTSPQPPTLAVIGTSMNSGKTTTIRSLVGGLNSAGYRAGCAKATGTGSGGDFWTTLDAGAYRMIDFTDVGLASTYRVPQAVIEQKFMELVDHLTDLGSDVILVEIADGLYQQDTARLIRSDVFRAVIDGVIFAAGDAMGAVAGVNCLRSLNVPLIGVSGRLTASPLAMREAAGVCGIPIYTRDDLRDPLKAAAIAGIPDGSRAADSEPDAAWQSGVAAATV